MKKFMKGADKYGNKNWEKLLTDRKSTDQDEEVQDPIKKAVDEALQSQAATLDALAAFVRDQVLGIARATVEKLEVK